MRHYEIVALVHPDRSSEDVDQMVERYQQLITDSGGQIHRYENWERRRLAYQIEGFYKASYVLLNAECTPEIKDELENQFRFNDSILRSLVIRLEKAVTEDSPIMKELIKKRTEEERLTADSAPAAKTEPKAKAEPKAKDTADEVAAEKSEAAEEPKAAEVAKDPETAEAPEAPAAAEAAAESADAEVEEPAEPKSKEPETKDE